MRAVKTQTIVSAILEVMQMSKLRQLTILTGLLVVAVVLLGVSTAWSAPQQFVDLDGDGFNDNDGDGNGDGIPDCLEPGYIPPVDAEELAGVFANMDMGDSPQVVLKESCKDCFGRLSFCTRSLTSNRSVFDTDFASGLGISVTGGACAGGVCQ
jgi:hypothetical protein